MSDPTISISRQAALNAVSWDSEAYSAIINLPIIDPVKHGKWIYLDGLDAFECSVCGRQMVRNIFNYCPWCGAKMERSEDPSHPFADDVMMAERSEE